jgi:hypothetical protein
MDFTVKKYTELLDSLIGAKYNFQTFEDFLTDPKDRVVILRHDVDTTPKNSLKFAKIQAAKKIKGVYYFRAVSESWDENIIKEIAALGHEIGYHYESLTTCKGNYELAKVDFEKNLKMLRNLAKVTTICMHGSPMSPYDSKDLWKKYQYKEFGIIGEPYFDVDFNTVFYITDTGRRWDGNKVSVRDKVKSTAFQLSFHSTDQVINSIENREFPSQVMFTFHPQRWHENKTNWLNELVFQGAKNFVKQYFFVNNSIE